jgi:hypothetical protein
MRRVRPRATSVVVALLLCAAAVLTPVAIAAEKHDGHRTSRAPRRVGVLVMDHGEPPVYNQDTYWSFRAFIDHLMEMEVIPSWLRALDLGTVLQDTGCYACPEPRTGAKLMDAWLRPYNGPAIFVPPTSDSLPAHHVRPGGPGLGEPDIFEHAGLQIWDEWRRMGGRSPNYDEKLAKKRALIGKLKRMYGDIPIRVGYGIDPRIGGGRQGIPQAVQALVNRDRVDSIVAVYHGVGFSDIMQTHMLRHEVHATIEELGANVAVRWAKPMGSSGHYTTAIVEKVRREVATLPDDAAVAVHLSGHGLSTTTCGGYDCGKDAYHAYAKGLFARISKAVRAGVKHTGRFGVFSVYADGSEGDSDPDNRVDSPTEGLAKRKSAGFTHVVDVPFEFDSNSRDTLIILRHAYRREIPDWNASYESRFTSNGIRVKIANANGGETHKIAAFEAVARAALSGWVTARPGAGPPQHQHHASGATTSASSAHAASSARTTGHDAATVHQVRTAVGVVHPVSTTSDEVHAATLQAAGGHGTLPGPRGTGIPIVVLGLVVLAGGAGGLAVGRNAAPVRSRLILGALAIQLAGFALDGWLHHRDGHPLSWFENGGHVAVLVGLALAAAAALDMVRSERD